jgi:hypothetical protein
MYRRADDGITLFGQCADGCPTENPSFGLNRQDNNVMASIDNLYAFIFNRCEYAYSSLPVYIGYGIGSDMKGFGFDDDGSSFFPSSSISHLSDDGQIVEQSSHRTHERTHERCWTSPLEQSLGPT